MFERLKMHFIHGASEQPTDQRISNLDDASEEDSAVPPISDAARQSSLKKVGLKYLLNEK